MVWLQRREFITLLGGAAAAWPLAAWAQLGERVRRIGVLMSGAETDPELQSQIAAFRQTLEQHGWSPGSQHPYRHSLCRHQGRSVSGARKRNCCA